MQNCWNGKLSPLSVHPLHSLILLLLLLLTTPAQAGLHGELWGAPSPRGSRRGCDPAVPQGCQDLPCSQGTADSPSLATPPQGSALSGFMARELTALCRFGFNPQLHHGLAGFLCWFLHLQLVSSSLPLSAFYDFGNWSGTAFSPSFTFHLSKGGECIPQVWDLLSACCAQPLPRTFVFYSIGQTWPWEGIFSPRVGF